ncbi:MAG TPA: metal-sulfur cluster assembly factor [Niabella sp.]|nr:metal-sulfur cluster assembly factor [Niabella sp.]HOZ97042.1 metal-sulfur cluster assembly factor [Niabella sp.]HQW15032.1 metal-sulfur cluster assembly factor [Niabella sp.]HQX20076.1 metal-sulfur cluster assembly factor [Niabella sp.]HQX40412.1 metal-sulfur cluster assembly factor [Niabella sp.]
MSVNVTTNDQEKCEAALKELYDVFDPEIGLNVVDLGLIYQIDFDKDEKELYATMTLTTQFCPMGESITSDVTQSLARAYPEWRINVDLTFDPPWEYSKISPEGNAFLGR